MNHTAKSLVLVCVGILVAAGVWMNLRSYVLSPSTEGGDPAGIERQAPRNTASDEKTGTGDAAPSGGIAEDIVRKALSGLSAVFSDTLLLGLLAVVVATVLLCRTLSRGVRMPAEVTVMPVQVPPHGASDRVEAMTESLMSLGFSHQLDFTLPELPHEGFFRLMADSRDKRTALISEIKAQGMAEPAHYIEFQTLVETGAKIDTNNNPIPTPFIPPPHVFVEVYPGMEDLSTLFDRHRSHEEGVLRRTPGAITLQRIEEFPARMRDDWREIIECQQACGLLEKDPNGDDYHGTSRLFLRYLWASLTSRLSKPRR